MQDGNDPEQRPTDLNDDVPDSLKPVNLGLSKGQNPDDRDPPPVGPPAEPSPKRGRPQQDAGPDLDPDNTD